MPCDAQKRRKIREEKKKRDAKWLWKVDVEKNRDNSVIEDFIKHDEAHMKDLEAKWAHGVEASLPVKPPGSQPCMRSIAKRPCFQRRFNRASSLLLSCLNHKATTHRTSSREFFLRTNPPPPALPILLHQDVFSALVSPRARRSPQTQRPIRSLNIDLQAGIEGTPVATETSRNHHLFAIRRQSSLSIHGTRVGLSRYRANVSLS